MIKTFGSRLRIFQRFDNSFYLDLFTAFLRSYIGRSVQLNPGSERKRCSEGFVAVEEEYVNNKPMSILGKMSIGATILLSCMFLACNNDSQAVKKDKAVPQFQNKGQELVFGMVQKVGDFASLVKKNNVTYTYTYQTPDGKSDVSTEKYIFDGEYSYGRYRKHERTMPQLEGVIEQGYDGHEYWLKHNGLSILKEDLLKKVAFSRPTNFYWFAMMQKLLDPGLQYEYLGEKSIANDEYDIVEVSFASEGEVVKDKYRLYINQKTSLVDQFLFTVADFGLMDPKLMQVKYEEVEGLLIPSKRQYKNSTWDAEVTEDPWILVTWSDIKFDTEMTKADFKK